jgi:outer membrane protein OmpA-like peptidoglycan-associated protein
MAKKTILILLGGALAAAPLMAQTTPPAAEPAPQGSTTTTTTTTVQQNSNIKVEPMDETPTYRVNVVERTTQAVDYRDRGGSTEIQMRGTQLMPQITGDTKVTGHTGRLGLVVNLHHMKDARELGLPYLTYVLWAITPEGRPVNLGEVIPDDDGDMKTQVTTSLSSFGLIVTAEPYFAVTRPGDSVVAENIIPNDVKGFIRTINAKFDLMDRGLYTQNVDPSTLPAFGADMRKVPLQLLEARDAIAIAKAAGARDYAADTLSKAESMLERAEDYYRRNQGKTPIGTAARSATQSAEDARLLTLNKKEEERAAAARARMQQRIANAQTEAEAQTERARLARQQAADELAQRERAEQEREAAQRAAEEAERARVAAEQAAQQSQQQLAEAQQQQQALQQQAEQARQQAQSAEQARAETERQAAEQRQRLVQQLNSVLQTKDTARGVVAQMSDVLFDINRATLKPDAKIRLAKVSGIVMAYPDLRLEIDGYTDSTGSEQRNQVLSEQRAATVRDFLISQGVPIDSVTAKGLGEQNPIASNDTVAGRKMNRRVELVLSGTAIGQNNAPGANPPTGTPPPGAIAAPPPKR